jgi:transposase
MCGPCGSQGARSVVLRAAGKKDRLSRWINRIRQDRGTNKAVVALANKMARIGWAILRHGTQYHPTQGYMSCVGSANPDPGLA